MADVEPDFYPREVREKIRQENDVSHPRIMWLINFQHLDACLFLLVIGLFLLGPSASLGVPGGAGSDGA
ncbi:MAG TPA: hypothetical protein VLT36_24730, partial [Candidatus Dormibacteraeota bacterium]|nr:hypothetical protein [Candidatus Dormibacteraeota bacterium]